MPVLTAEKIKIFRTDGNSEVVVFSHGAYTPKHFPFKGSGKVRVPDGLQVYFYATADEFGVGSKTRILEAMQKDADWLREHRIKEEVPSSGKIINYRLEKKEGDKEVLEHANLLRDLIIIRTDMVAHLKDVFDAIEHFHLDYDVLHCIHCRVTRATANQV